MPLELQIIRASEFIRLGALGHFDLAASKSALAMIARACRKRGVDQALIDLRELQPGPQPVFSRKDLVELVNTFCQAGFTRQHRLAVLYRTDPHQRARLFAFLSVLHGWTVRAFDNFEAAMDWLSSGPEAARPVRSATEKPIPVRAPKHGPEPATLAVSPAGHPRKMSAGRKKIVAAMAQPGSGRKPHTNLRMRQPG